MLQFDELKIHKDLVDQDCEELHPHEPSPGKIQYLEQINVKEEISFDIFLHFVHLNSTLVPCS